MNPEVPLIIIGAGGHGKVLASLVLEMGRKIYGVCDPKLKQSGVNEWRGFRVLGDDSVLDRFQPNMFELALGVGVVLGSNVRCKRYQELIALGYRFPPLVHPSAVIDKSAIIEDGVQIMARAVVQSDTVIGKNSIVNTCASIDHDCTIGEHVHIAPGAVLCGMVSIGNSSFVGASATILPIVKVGHNCIVAAGSTLASDLKNGEKYLPHRKN
jgi:sugar O-acyltransferase (sialic acid O-acetyltransferase NeuD family)